MKVKYGVRSVAGVGGIIDYGASLAVDHCDGVCGAIDGGVAKGVVWRRSLIHRRTPAKHSGQGLG
jgi:hypothetical protein